MRVSTFCKFLFVTILLSACNAFAQNADTWRVSSCTVDSMVITIDTLSIVPNSFSILNAPTESYQIDPYAAKLYLKDSSLLGQVISYTYEVFSTNFSRPFSHKPLSIIENRLSPDVFVSSLPTSASEQDDCQLTSSGSIARGVSVGNNQNLVLNSALNLQLVGNLSEDVRIVASISDKNIPIQPEGNTTYLTNINNIFFTLYYKDILKIDAGDIEIRSPYSQFLSVSRNLLGMDGYTSFSSWKKMRMSNALGGGVAKGRYTRQKLTVLNGVQGPYKLYGTDNESGIVIVAGSERVYLDGSLLTRGAEQDYVIDYNTAEISFTPEHLMAEEMRVFVEFEYTDRHFTRINLFTYNDFEFGKDRNFKLHVNYFQEQDLKNHSIQPELNNDQKLFLSDIGDAIENAYYHCADSTEFMADRILYCLKDTVVDGVSYGPLYEYSIDHGKQLYSLNFTYMGPNRGSYVLLRSTSNGRVFGWVAPVNGMPQGEYEPVVLLSTPKLQQMATLRAEYYFKQESFIQTELAMSNFDQNLFSKKDDHDNVGFAYFVKMNHSQPLKSKKNDQPAWQMHSALDWQFVHKNFQAVESFRNVEFARDYNLASDYSSDFSEQMLQALIGFSKSKVSDSRYKLNWFSRIGDYSAVRQELSTHNTMGRWRVDAMLSYLLSNDSVQKSRYSTGDLTVLYKIKKIEIGAKDKAECNLFKDALQDTLRMNSFAFNEFTIFVKNGDSSLYKFDISYKNRMEYAVEGDRLGEALQIHQVGAAFAFDRIKNQHFSTKAFYRGQRASTMEGVGEFEHYFVGNVEYVGRFFKNALVLNTYYEAGSGMEQRKNFSYIKVAAGQGTHVWIDYNGNGIEELDEFEVAAFRDEAQYLKVWLPAMDYVNTFNNQFTQSIQLRPAAVWSNKKGFRRFLARFTDVATLRSQLKNERPSFNPFYSKIQDTTLIYRMFNFNNTFSFNNSSSKFAFDFVVQELQNKNLIYYGFEWNKTSLQQLVLKSHPCDLIQLRAEYVHSVLDNQSEFLENRCYRVEKHGVGGSFSIQWKARCQGVLSYMYDRKVNLLGVEKLFAHKLSASFEYRMSKRGVASASLSYVGIQGNADERTAVSYQMLNGLAIGHNVLWGVNYQMAITEFLQLSLQYEGRAVENHKATHAGSVILKAQF